MKLSLRWVCDHLSIAWDALDLQALVHHFNTKVAEIETTTEYSLDLGSWYAGKVQEISENSITFFVPEIRQTISLPFRSDAIMSAIYFVKKEGSLYSWLLYSDIYIEKEGLVGVFALEQSLLEHGSWRKKIETTDVIIDIDNKSITHRPDLWSHRGFAREVAPFLKTKLRSEDDFFAPISIEQYEKEYQATQAFPFTLSIDTQEVSFFSMLYYKNSMLSPSVLWMGFRLSRVGQRPIDYVVDATNYVMFDIGQPLHAFDAQKVSKYIGPRKAKNGEQLIVLNNEHLTLQETDIVIANDTQALALAGIKGGMASGVSTTTDSLLVEAATFSGGSIRRSSCFHKLRSESSARFEKELDPEQALQGLKRFAQLLIQDGIAKDSVPSGVAIGSLVKPIVINITQSFIEDRLGIMFKKDDIKTILESAHYKVIVTKKNDDQAFTITVPSYRATKDIKIKEDIVEEVGRLYGYEHIPEKLPVVAKKVFVDAWQSRLYAIKQFLAVTGKMQEVYNYALLDNDFLKKIDWNIVLPVEIAHPLSEQATTLVDSLVIPLLKNVDEIAAKHEQAAFFEYGRAWHTDPAQSKVIEQKKIAGILYQRKNEIDFYKQADLLKDLYALCGIKITLKKSLQKPLWAHAYQVADIISQDTIVGKVGMINGAIMHGLGGGHAWAFEFDATYVLEHKQAEKRFVPFSKYQGSYLDISMMTPLSYSVETLQMTIALAHRLIKEVQLQDVFQRPEWQDEKSVTFRYFVQDEEQSVTKDMLIEVQLAVEKAVHGLGVRIR